MDFKMQYFIDSQRHRFVERDEKILGTILRQVEDEWQRLSVEDGQKESLELFWLHLMELAVIINNVQLCLLIVGRLKMVQLALILRCAIQSNDEITQFIAVNYLANYMNIKTKSVARVLTSLPSRDDQSSIYKLKQVMEYFVDNGQWDNAFSLLDGHFLDEKQKQSVNKMLMHSLSQNQEDNENFEAALDSLVHSAPTYRHCKLLIKHHERAGFSKVKDFLLKNNSTSAYSELSIVSGLFEDLLKSTGTYKSGFQVSTVLEYRRCLETHVMDSIPSKTRDFLEDNSGHKWLDKRNIEFIKSQISILDNSVRTKLFEIAHQHELTGKLASAAALYLSLDCQYMTNQILPRYLGYVRAMEGCRPTGPQMMDSLRRVFCEVSSSVKSIDKSKSLFRFCIKQGLVDEAIQFLIDCNFDSESCFIEATETLEDFLNDIHVGLLDTIDPEISQDTLARLNRWPNIDQNISTHVITIVILSTTIFLLKLDTNNSLMFSVSTPKLEVMFQGIAEYLSGKSFVASSSLINATNSLISAIKGRLDALCDSDVIRKAFKGLVEATADRCMMEGRHKSAAMLYNQIEDHVNSVKCLMRTGDVDVVINYSLLVRDATVNRITINYLRHLNVEAATIENFISKSRV